MDKNVVFDSYDQTWGTLNLTSSSPSRLTHFFFSSFQTIYNEKTTTHSHSLN